jgi:predicted Zn-dependent peptidase
MTVQVSKLDNGLTVVTEQMPHLESTALGVWVKAGARNEQFEQHGVAHLLEHMAFKGTKRRSAARIAEEIENVGGDVNAATSVETTAYYVRVLRDDVALGVDILHDIIANSTFETREIDREKHVILQEIGAANDTPDDIVFDLFQETAFANQPIGRPILGTRETVSALKREDLRNYLEDHYTGPGMILSAAGAVDHEALVRQAAETFGNFRAESGPPCPPSFYCGGEKIVPRDFQEVQIVLGFEGRAYQARDFYASQLLAMVLGGGMSSRLFQEIREKRGLCYSVYAFHWAFADSGIFGIHAATEEGDTSALVPVILDELEKATEAISQAELDRARAQIRASLLMSMESPSARAGQLAQQILLFGRPIPNEELTERLLAISTGRLQDLAQRTFFGSNPTLAAVGPVSDLMRHHDIAERLGISAAHAAAE